MIAEIVGSITHNLEVEIAAGAEGPLRVDELLPVSPNDGEDEPAARAEGVLLHASGQYRFDSFREFVPVPRVLGEVRSEFFLLWLHPSSLEVLRQVTLMFCQTGINKLSNPHADPP